MRNLAEGGVNIHWLLTGEGEMLLEDEKRPAAEVQAGVDLALSIAGDVEASARYQAFCDDLSAKSRETEADLAEIERTEGFNLPTLTRMNFRSLMAMNREYTPVIRLAVKELAELYRVPKAPEPSSPVNYELLQSLIEMLERILKERRLVLEPARKAAAIQIMYEYCMLDEKAASPATVEKFLKLVA